MRAAVLLPASLLLFPSAGTEAQQPVRIDIYRYILDMDVPEPAALVALDAGPVRVLRGSAPKPLAASVVQQHDGGGWRTGIGVDAAPWYVLGGGERSLAAHRAMTVQGRIMRVLTKTVVSVAAQPATGGGGSHLGFGVRSTLHDPHDPSTGSRLPEQVDSILRHEGDDPRRVRPELDAAYAAARRQMRARAGDAMVSAGWGLARVARDGDVAGREGHIRHTAWVSAQHTRGPRTDVLAMVQLVDAFRDDRALRVGTALQTKATRADLRTGIHYDTRSQRLHPEAALEAHLLPGTGAVLAVARDDRASESGNTLPVRVAMMVRWYFVTRN